MFLQASLSGHQDSYYTHKAGNVTFTILTGFEFEEITKCRLVAEQVADLCEVLGYGKDVRIDYKHLYTTDTMMSDIFVSVGKQKIIENEYGSWPFKTKKKATLYIRIIADQVPIEKLLRTAKFAVTNEKEIKAKQVNYDYKRGYTDWKLYTFPPKELANAIVQYASESLWAYPGKKYYAREDNEGGTISYYLQKGSFHVFYQRNGWTEEALFSTPRLYLIEASDVDFNFALVFLSPMKFKSIFFLSDPTEISKVVKIPEGWYHFFGIPESNFMRGRRAYLNFSKYITETKRMQKVSSTLTNTNPLSKISTAPSKNYSSSRKNDDSGHFPLLLKPSFFIRLLTDQARPRAIAFSVYCPSTRTSTLLGTCSGTKT